MDILSGEATLSFLDFFIGGGGGGSTLQGKKFSPILFFKSKPILEGMGLPLK